MLTLAQIEQVGKEVNDFVKAALAGNAPIDGIATAAAIGSAILTKGLDPAADLAALQALNKFNSDLIAARGQAVAAGAPPNVVPQ